MILTDLYFKGKLAIANAQDKAPNSNLLGNSIALTENLLKYERECLIKLLGYSLYKEFCDQFVKTADTWVLKDPVDAKWTELLEGKEYTLNGVNVCWRGLIFSDDAISTQFPQSLLADYVYTKFLENDTNHTSVGHQSEQAKGSEKVSSRSMWASAWNDFVDKVHNGNNGERSLYEFIQDMNSLDPTTYVNWNAEVFEYKNRYV